MVSIRHYIQIVEDFSSSMQVSTPLGHGYVVKNTPNEVYVELDDSKEIRPFDPLQVKPIRSAPKDTGNKGHSFTPAQLAAGRNTPILKDSRNKK